MRRTLLPLLAPAFLAALAADAAHADFVYTRTGPPVEGRVLEDGPSGVKVNPYYSQNPLMTWEVVTIPRAQVVKVILDRPKEREYLFRAARLEHATDARKHYELFLWCEEQKLKTQARVQAELALEADPAHEGARKALGAAADKLLAETRQFREKQKPLIEAYAAEVDGEKRKAIFRELGSAGFQLPQAWLDRVARSLGAPTGRFLDRKIVFRAEAFPGAVYSIQIPKAYDPLRPWPLVLGLHGGGPAGKDGKEVVGSGPMAMPFYEGETEARGYILVCPTALSAPWPNTDNEGFLTALLTEIVLVYNVDLNRVFLIGHSMGGGGTWHYGPKWAETFASVAPLSAYNSGGFSRLHETATGAYFYHGDDDPRCPVDSSRAAAKALKKLGADFVYTEIPRSGHSLPDYIVKEAFDFFDARRLGPAKKPGLFGAHPKPGSPFSSFLLPATAEEKKYLSERKAGGVASLVNDLAKGGGAAEKAAAAIAAHEDKERAVGPLRGLLRSSENEDVRRLAARVLGEVGGEKAAPDLGAALDDKVPAVRAEAAEALGRIGGEGAAAQIAKGAALAAKHFESRLAGGNRIDSVDWEIQTAVLARFLGAAGKFADDKVAAAAGKSLVEGVLIRDFAVDYDKEVEPDPRRSLHKLALAAVRAFEGMKSPKGIDPVRKLLEKYSEVPEIAAEAKRVLGVLEKGG